MTDLAQRYQAALRAHLEHPDEQRLQQAYELGRQALAENRGILDMLGQHQEALRAAASSLDPSQPGRAGEFLAEALSPFEMTHRAFGESNQRLRRLNEALEAETRRIATELHDESGQLLAAVHIQLRELARELPAAASARLVQAIALLDQIEHQLRRFAHELRPAVLDDYGLMAALRAFSQTFSRRTGLPVYLEGQLAPRLPRTVEAAMYRIGQEALNNAARHAQASRVTIRMSRGPLEFHCSIGDDGVGFDAATAGKGHGLGLVGMRERLAALQGTLQIVSVPGHGSELRISVPLQE